MSESKRLLKKLVNCSKINCEQIRNIKTDKLNVSPFEIEKRNNEREKVQKERRVRN